jgi:crossover junction endodeoxyribonuclease RuvC
MIIGIDPGLKGALVLRDGNRIKSWYYMPTVAKGHGTGQQVDAYRLDAIFMQWSAAADKVQKVCIERVSARPNQGVSGMFSFGRSIGVIEGMVACYQWPLHWALPTAWKRRAGLLKADKDAARAKACELFPELSHHLRAKGSVGLADAALISLYGVMESTDSYGT